MGELRIRNAEVGDAPDLANFAVMAGHGVMELLYADLYPGKSLINTIIERRIFAPQSVAALKYWFVATDKLGNVMGGINCYSHALRLAAPRDPLITEARLKPIAALVEMEATATDSYYLSSIAVLPRYRGSSAGFMLMQEVERQARSEHLRRISLSTFENDPKLLRFYRRHGFEVRATCPIGHHPAMEIAGNFALMMRDLDS